MRCIFPCLQLIYFYMVVDYIVLCFDCFFPPFALWGQDWGGQCCTAYALLRQTEHT